MADAFFDWIVFSLDSDIIFFSKTPADGRPWCGSTSPGIVFLPGLYQGEESEEHKPLRSGICVCSKRGCYLVCFTVKKNLVCCSIILNFYHSKIIEHGCSGEF
jgi:hypothetical protein